ncbi:MAG: hypothetical protein PF588_08085 [Candidatus Kapabacteria bacterium]|nr:hypothetical protein [Candidatus Kapabacteria bacterium]
MKKYYLLTLFSLLLLINSCSDNTAQVDKFDLDSSAERFVFLVLSTGKYDKNYVDAYYGPEELKESAEKTDLSLPEIIEQADVLSATLLENYNSEKNPEIVARHNHLIRMCLSLKFRAQFIDGRNMTFDEESLLIYDAVAPSNSYEHYDTIIAELEDVLPGEGDLDKRFVEYRNQFIIPTEKLDDVFKSAVAEGRRRTKLHIKLPENESFKVEYVKDVSWGAYNWYKGNGFSLIQVNTDMPIYIDRAVDLACHEGYPGHHVYHTLLDMKYYRDSNWVEHSVYPLFSPKSILSEGTANFGISVAFPNDERMKFEKEVLFPLAGLDPEKVEEYYKIIGMTKDLNYVGNDIARDYLDGKIDRVEAVKKVMKYRLRTKEHAESNVDFYEIYRAYLITYNLGEDMVKDYVESKGGTADRPDKRWEEFIKIITVSMMPSELKLN